MFLQVFNQQITCCYGAQSIHFDIYSSVMYCSCYPALPQNSRMQLEIVLVLFSHYVRFRITVMCSYRSN